MPNEDDRPDENKLSEVKNGKEPLLLNPPVEEIPAVPELAMVTESIEQEIENNILSLDDAKQIDLIVTQRRYNKDIRSLVSANMSLIQMLLHLAEMLHVKLKATKLNSLTGEVRLYETDVFANGSYDDGELRQIQILVKTAINRTANQLAEATQARLQAEERLETQNKTLQANKLVIQQLSVVKKHPIIGKKSFVLAYLNGSGDFVYLGKREKDNVQYNGRVKLFSKATKFATMQEALAALTALLKDFNHAIPLAYEMKIYNAHLVEQTDLPGDLEKLREHAKTYEGILKGSSKHGKNKDKNKSKKKKSSKNKRDRRAEKSAVSRKAAKN